MTNSLFFGLTCAIVLGLWSVRKSGRRSETFEVSRSDEQWRAQLAPDAYRVLRQQATEKPHSSALNAVTGPGVFQCAGCGHLLFHSAHKFDSGTGWPSFYQPVNQMALGSHIDYGLIIPRVEVHCARCGGHLGHVFNDGPPPTGKRYCINGVSLNFLPEK